MNTIPELSQQPRESRRAVKQIAAARNDLTRTKLVNIPAAIAGGVVGGAAGSARVAARATLNFVPKLFQRGSLLKKAFRQVDHFPFMRAHLKSKSMSTAAIAESIDATIDDTRRRTANNTFV